MAEVINFPRRKASGLSDQDIFRKAFETAAAEIGCYASAAELEVFAYSIALDVRGGERNAKKLCDHALMLHN
jgi:hypothetical protein